MTRNARDPRLEELLADEALFGLTEDERRELASTGAAHDESYELAAAAADLATLELESMPAALEAKIATALAAGGGKVTEGGGVVRTMPRRAPVLPWLAAAACGLLAVGGWWAYATKPAPIALVHVELPPPPAPRPKTPAEERAALLERAPDARTIAWSATKDPAGRDVAGDVVWSEAEQRGFMRLRGLPANDPARSEYQLWVFDATQDHPVDGGVFDVPAAPSGEVVVPITAKIRVSEPTLFAVTIEKPGGVVVSKREHIVAVAAVKG